MYTSNIHAWIAEVVRIVPAFLLAFSIHEFSHALVAVCLGDSTPRQQGRLTMNPLAHIDPLGMLFLIIIRIGWGKPVEFNKDNFKHPRLYSVLTALAGPFSNYIMAFLCIILLKYISYTPFNQIVVISISQILNYCIYVNVMLGTFNLFPIPPLDGSHLITSLFSESHPEFVEALHRYSFLIFIAVFFLIPQTQQFFISTVRNITTFLISLVA